MRRRPCTPRPSGASSVPRAAGDHRRRDGSGRWAERAGEASRFRRRVRGDALTRRGARARGGVHARNPIEAHPGRRSPGRAVHPVARVPARRIVRSPRPRVHVLRGRGRIAERLRGAGRLHRHPLGTRTGDALRERARVRPCARDRARHPTPHRADVRARQPLQPAGAGGDPRGHRGRRPGRGGRPGDGRRGDRHDRATTDQLHAPERDGSGPDRDRPAGRRRIRPQGDGGSLREAPERRTLFPTPPRVPLHAPRHHEPDRGGAGPRGTAPVQAAPELGVVLPRPRHAAGAHRARCAPRA